jgi:hypothetical protein
LGKTGEAETTLLRFCITSSGATTEWVFVPKLRGKIIDRKKLKEKGKSKDFQRRIKETNTKSLQILAPDLCLSRYVVHLNKKYKYNLKPF